MNAYQLLAKTGVLNALEKVEVPKETFEIFGMRVKPVDDEISDGDFGRAIYCEKCALNSICKMMQIDREIHTDFMPCLDANNRNTRHFELVTE